MSTPKSPLDHEAAAIEQLPSSYDVVVVDDPASRGLADGIAADFARGGHRVTRTHLHRFPIADPLPALLGRLAPSGGLAVVAVSPDSANRAWVLAELGLPNLYPRVLVAVPTVADAPRWATAGDPRVLVPGSTLPKHSP